jgi:MT0933-like antitoxin protein
MGFIDTLKGLVGGHKQQAEQGVDHAGTLADEKMDGAHAQQVQEGEQKADEAINKLPEEG